MAPSNRWSRALSALAGGHPAKALSEALSAQLDEDPFQRDPRYIEEVLPRILSALSYFKPQVRGLDAIPQEACLVVGNHCGGLYTPEAYVLMARWFAERGAEAPLYGLGHTMAFVTPIANMCRKAGILPANEDNAHAALDRGAPLLIYPGGDHEAFRPWTQRARIDFGGRRGFVRLALRRQVKVYPVVAHGSHETTVVLARGTRIARALELERFRVKIFPVVAGLPWGVAPGFFPFLPLPSQITIQVGEPLDWTALGPEAAEDPQVVWRCYDEITDHMQAILTALHQERPRPVLSRALSP